MTLNPSSMAPTAYDMLDGSISGFYADVDEAIVASEVVKGQYRMTINPAYNSPNPVDSNSFTTVGLTQSGPMVVDLENSYITTDIAVKLNHSAKLQKGAGFFFGWKRSIEAIDKYDILVNSTPIYTQSFCGEESFIQYQVLSDLVKHTTPFVYTSSENAKKLDPNVCGTYVILADHLPVDKPLCFTIPIKIPVTDFLLLRNLKYLISWMGKWELRLYFDLKNMIVLPLKQEAMTAAGVTGGVKNDDAINYNTFRQLQETFKVMGCGTQDAAEAQDNTFTKHTMTMNNVEMNSASFQLRMDILEMLKQKYLAEKPLTFPCSSIQIARFTGIPGQTNQLNIVLCQAINNCDTLFILPFQNTFQHTCCYQPWIKNLQLHAGEYGSYPNQPYSTFNETDANNIRFVNSVMDALNVNASPIISMNRDVAYTFIDTFIQKAAPSGAITTENINTHWDQSNFFIPFPFSIDSDFQGGLSSPTSNINFKLTGTISAPQGTDINNQTPWVACFLVDSVIMIRPDPGSDAAKVIWSDRTVC